ncbi:MAG TPA: beta-1,6-N-acetylglucosaminyltransferase [Puia sp.]|jgi:hypothetical protein|nr:beta-1,6-N-acetylglucosaminyltransferase [Puia sp.]
MRIAHIIVFHQDSIAIERLLQALAHPQFDVYLHLDQKVDLAPFAYLSRYPNTYFVKNRKQVRWGGFSQIEAMLNSLHEILDSGRSYDFVNLLSGQDYPVVQADYIYDFFLQHRGRSFMTCETPPTPWWNEAMHRFINYHFIDYGFRGKHRLGMALSAILPGRRFPLPYQLYGGSDAAYWILSIEAANYICSSLKKINKYRTFFKHTWSPDEFLVSTLLMNSPLKGTVIQENYHYMDRSLGGSHPKVLTMQDFPNIVNSGKFFARKFDRSVDEDILNRIDEELLFPKNKIARSK